MSRAFDIKLDKISEFYQAFNICAIQVLLPRPRPVHHDHYHVHDRT